MENYESDCDDEEGEIEGCEWMWMKNIDINTK